MKKRKDISIVIYKHETFEQKQRNRTKKQDPDKS